ncbi:MAG: bacteriohemerythrin [Treponema sp.]|jgi:hemerythrin|nr:bacteriohemerythrin [Treponema sp.]
MEKNNTVEWDDRYTVGVQMIDEQHKELFNMINNFYPGCLKEDEKANIHFKLMVYGFINYSKYHFATEEQFLERLKYPDSLAHKRQHDEFIRVLLERMDKIELGQPVSFKHFTRYIRDWLVTHITLIDKKYATYIHFINGQIKTADKNPLPVIHKTGQFHLAEPAEIPSEIFFG